ncbi:MAG: tetratricopeptide repeat protein [Nitrospirae bacterium]|nr:tetratricopeptide repeat protein [Nitrospirota bacterium]
MSVEHHIAEAYSLLNWEVITSSLLLIIIMAIGILVIYSRSILSYGLSYGLWRMVSFFIFWFFIVLAPTTIIPLESILQENRGYLAAISFAVILATLLSRISSLKFSGKGYLFMPYTIIIFLLVLILAAYAAGTIRRNTTWKDDITLWSDAVRKEPLSARAHANLGVSYAQKKEIGSAIVEYQKAIELAPNIKYPHYALGSIYSKLNLFELAIYEYKKTIEIDQGYYRAWNNLGMTYWEMGRLDTAIYNFKRALAINPDYTLPYLNIGRIYEQQGRIDEAYRELEIAKEKALSIPGEKRNAEYAIEYMKRFKMKYK